MPGSVGSGVAPASAVSQVVSDSAKPVPGAGSLNGVACGSATSCVAVGSDSGEGVIVYVVSISNGIWSNDWAVPGNGEPGAPDQVSLYSIGCYRSSCWGGGTSIYEGSVIAPIQDKGGPGALESVDPFGEVQGLACIKDFCAAVGQAISASQPKSAAAAYSIVDGKLHDAGYLSKARFLGGVACRSTSWCISVGTSYKQTQGVVALLIDNSLGAAEFVPTTGALDGVACSKTQNECLAVGFNNASEGVVLRIDGGAPRSVEVVKDAQDLTGVACPTNTSCLVVGDSDADQGVLGKVRLPTG